MAPYQLHVKRWEGCTRCDLCHERSRVVLSRGRLPCDVLFVGEAPGVSEDALGVPFVGPAGKLLDKIVEQALSQWQVPGTSGSGYNSVTTAFTNLAACFPREAKRAGDNEPPKEAVEACSPRLREFVALAKPRLIVCVGGLAEKWVPKLLWPGNPRDLANPQVGSSKIACVGIKHPAAILRESPATQSLSAQKCVVAIADAVEEMIQ